MTAADLQAARSRVDQRTTDLAQAQEALAVVEHAEYRDGLSRIAGIIGDLPASNPSSQQLEQATSAIEVVLDGLGFTL